MLMLYSTIIIISNSFRMCRSYVNSFYFDIVVDLFLPSVRFTSLVGYFCRSTTLPLSEETTFPMCIGRCMVSS
jgi:hypothetical protein